MAEKTSVSSLAGEIFYLLIKLGQLSLTSDDDEFYYFSADGKLVYWKF